MPSTLSEGAGDLLRNLLQREPTRRISLAQAKKHAFFREVNFEGLLAGLCGRATYRNLSEMEKSEVEHSGSETNSNYESFSDVDYEPEPKPRINRVTKFSFDREVNPPNES